MKDLNFVLEILVKSANELNKRRELTLSEEQLRRDLGEAFEIVKDLINKK